MITIQFFSLLFYFFLISSVCTSWWLIWAFTIYFGLKKCVIQPWLQKPYNAKNNVLFCFDASILINQINSYFERNAYLITSHKKNYVYTKFVIFVIFVPLCLKRKSKYWKPIIVVSSQPNLIKNLLVNAFSSILDTLKSKIFGPWAPTMMGLQVSLI